MCLSHRWTDAVCRSCQHVQIMTVRCDSCANLKLAIRVRLLADLEYAEPNVGLNDDGDERERAEIDAKKAHDEEMVSQNGLQS